MARGLTFLLRICILASAAAMLLLCVHAARAQDFSPAPGSSATPPAGATDSVYGFNPGQGTAQSPDPVEQPAPYVPAPQVPYGPAPQAPYGYYPSLAQQTQSAPPASAPPPAMVAQAQAPYGYNATQYASTVPPQPMPGQAMPQYQPPPQGYGYVPDRTTNYGTQMPADPQAYYQQPYNGQGARTNSDYQLGPGDKIRVTVFGEADLSGEYDVDGSGVVRLPLIGTLHAAGYTAPGLEAWIAATLAKGYLKNPRVNVEIATYRPFYIVGAVNRPGQYPFVDHMNALNAVAVAGGFTEKAKKSTVYVRHEGSVNEEEVPTDALSRLRPGDVIRVDTTLFWDAMDVFAPIAPAAIAAVAVAP